tara:strand:+ start:212 stop:457 length:246 start_codon:yes stop_codon:yes gene_type:complete
LTLLIDESRQLEYPVVNRYTRLVVTLCLVVTPARNNLGIAVALDKIPYCIVQRTGEIFLSYRLTVGADVCRLQSEQQKPNA